MKVITPENRNHVFNDLDTCVNSIFLAGPCPRDDYSDDWRNEAIEILKELGFTGTVLNPTNKYYDETDKDHLEKQTNWEYEAMHKASAIVFWIERSDEHPALTTNIEFGNWIGKHGCYYGWTNDATHNNYLVTRLKMIGANRYDNLYELLSVVVNDLNRPTQRWFLSDTHFSQQRTLELSKRPFINTKEMDLTIISNWNKTIRMNDIVYFLGDFGETFNNLKLLNFKELKFVLGNYERKDSDGNSIKEDSIKSLKKINRDIAIFDRGELTVELSNGMVVTLVHEPIAPADYKSDYSDKLYLYGHIHGRDVYKHNGTDVAVDANYFYPLSEDHCIWRLNAIKYLDENIWEMTCE